MLDPAITRRRRLRMFAYAIEIIEGRIDVRTQSEILDLLADWGFQVEPHRKRFNTLDEVQSAIESYETLISNLDFQADGVVVKVDRLALHGELGVVGGREPRWAIARKFAPEVAVTRLGNRVRVGGTAELTGYNLKLRESRRQTLNHVVTDLFPHAGDVSKSSFWTGLRPMTPDGPPVIGKSKIANLWFNTGHGTLGWTMAAGSGRLLSDLISSKLIKDTLVVRTRPCGEPLIIETVRFIANYCPVSSSFTSSHACNHFALAFFIYRTLRHTSRWWGLVFVWAFLISYAQVYVGVHFPLDVTCGAIIGSIIGWQLSRVFRFQFGTLHLQPYNTSHA